MAELITHNAERIETIYQLLGDKENDITRAIAWTLKKCPSFLCAFIKRLHKAEIDPEAVTIFYQQFEKTGDENGYTDLEITDDKTFHIILEAKRGWILPGSEQLTKYAHRPSFIGGKASNKYIVTVSECSQEYASCYLPFKKTDNGIPASHISWKELKALTEKARVGANHEQKHLLNEFALYLGGIMTMQNKDSNKVYVVAISRNTIDDTGIRWTDIIDSNHYFCPIGINGWPKEPPNYIAFRYDGKLQTIHHIEGYTVTKNMHDVIDFMPDVDWETDHFIFDLGPAIVPNKVIRTGKGIYRNGRVWAAIDLLLTCDTITEARDKTKERG